MRSRLSAFSLLDLVVGAAVSALLVSIGIPTGARVRELSKRSTCALNLAGIGASAKIYANENNEKWMIPAFRRAYIETGIIYTLPANGIGGPGQTGFERVFETLSETAKYPNAGSTQVAVTRAYWMLVRSGDVTKQFVCPSSGDSADPTEDIDLYYDFADYTNISYGYQVPFGPRDTQPREGMDHRQAVAADKGPWYLSTYLPNWRVEGFREVNLNDPPKLWRPFNSPNHGGLGNGEGQSVLFANGGVSFLRIPAVGIDNDNIYTLMTNEWGSLGFNRIHGDSPTEYVSPPYPGRDTFGPAPGQHSSTDSLIYP